MFSSIIALGSLAALVAAAPMDTPNALVNNRCPFGVSVWSNNNGPVYIDSLSIWSQPLVGQSQTLLVEQGRHDSGDIWLNTPKVSFGYTVQNNLVYYDLETLSGGWPSDNLLLAAPGSNCGSINFPNGQNPNPGQDHTLACNSPTKVILTLCA